MSEHLNVPEIFGSDVFNEATMQERLPEHVYNASACGDNCAAWLLRIGKEKDVLVRLGHQMRFTEEPFDIRIENTGQVVHTRQELVTAVISQGLLEETL
jgi:hypothetical protein